MESDLIALKTYAAEVQDVVERIMYADHMLNRCMILIENRNYGSDISDETYYTLKDVYMDLFREQLDAESKDFDIIVNSPMDYFLN